MHVPWENLHSTLDFLGRKHGSACKMNDSISRCAGRLCAPGSFLSFSIISICIYEHCRSRIDKLGFGRASIVFKTIAWENSIAHRIGKFNDLHWEAILFIWFSFMLIFLSFSFVWAASLQHTFRKQNKILSNHGTQIEVNATRVLLFVESIDKHIA